MQLLIVGCGYLGHRVAQHWRAAGHQVTALTRSISHAERFRASGIQPLVGDVLEPDSLRSLPACDTLLYAVGYDRSAGVDKRRVYVDGLRNVLSVIGDRVGRFLYISSSSVYGQDQGEWVDESSSAAPQSEGGRICLAAETLLRESDVAQSGRAVILRLTGIYGPGRLLTRVESLQAGATLAGSPDAWLNLIHVDDAAAAVVAAAEHPHPESLYLITDDLPITRGEYYSELARRIGAPHPNFDPTQQPRHGRGLNKRCRNQLAKDSLGMTWRFPTFRDGLQASLVDTIDAR